jgi:hypothetical protein
MATLEERMKFLYTLDREYQGRALFKVDSQHSTVELDERNRISRAQIVVTLYLGTPKEIGMEQVYPAEMPGIGVYDLERDGELSWNEVARFALRCALDSAWRGGSALLFAPDVNPLL